MEENVMNKYIAWDKGHLVDFILFFRKNFREEYEKVKHSFEECERGN